MVIQLLYCIYYSLFKVWRGNLYEQKFKKIFSSIAGSASGITHNAGSIKFGRDQGFKTNGFKYH